MSVTFEKKKFFLGLNNDYKGALEFCEQLLEKDIILDKQLELQLKKLKNCNIKKSINSV